MIIKVDVDGVIRDLPSSLCQVYNQLNSEDSKTALDMVYYDVNKSFPMIETLTGFTANEYFFVEKCTEVFREKAKPYNGVRQAMEKLINYGHKVVICTWQPTYQAKLDTLGFLDDWKIPYSDICFTRDKYIVKGDYLIDDNTEFLLNAKEDSYPVLIRHPYNVEFEKIFSISFGSLKEAADVFSEKPYI